MGHSQSLIDLIKANGVKSFVEVGVFKSQNLKSIIKNTNLSAYYAIDKFEPETQPHYGWAWCDRSQATWSQYHFQCCQLIRWFPQLHVIKLPSASAATCFTPMSIDMVFIDGSHFEGDVIADIILWGPIVKSGGLITGHDYDEPKHPGVTPAVNRMFGKDRIEVYPGRVWAVEKS